MKDGERDHPADTMASMGPRYPTSKSALLMVAAGDLEQFRVRTAVDLGARQIPLGRLREDGVT